jgi:hypothetical protein
LNIPLKYCKNIRESVGRFITQWKLIGREFLSLCIPEYDRESVSNFFGITDFIKSDPSRLNVSMRSDAI